MGCRHFFCKQHIKNGKHDLPYRWWSQASEHNLVMWTGGFSPLWISLSSRKSLVKWNFVKPWLNLMVGPSFSVWWTKTGPIVHFTVVCLVAKPLNRVTLLWYKPCCFSNANYKMHVIMLTRYWSLSPQGQDLRVNSFFWPSFGVQYSSEVDGQHKCTPSQILHGLLATKCIS